MNRNQNIKLSEIKEKYINQPNFTPIEGYQNLFGLAVYKSGRKHVKIEHVYYFYTAANFDYQAYKNSVFELSDYERKNGYEFRQTYNLSRYEIFGNLYLYQLNTCVKDWKVNFNKFEWLRLNKTY